MNIGSSLPASGSTNWFGWAQAIHAALTNIAKADVGLGNVNNTADADKPVSSATATAISGAISGQTRRAMWNGSAYTVGTFVVASNNRPANVFYDFIGGPDPASLNIGVVNGDTWQDAS